MPFVVIAKDVNLYKTEQKYLHIWESENRNILTFLTMNQSSKKLVSIFLLIDRSVSPLMNAALLVLGGGGYRDMFEKGRVDACVVWHGIRLLAIQGHSLDGVQ